MPTPAPSPTATVPTTGTTTTDLVHAACAGDAGAWQELVNRYSTYVRCVVATFRLPEAEAADAVQNTWLRAVERLATVREPERLGGWLRKIAERECLEAHRRIRRELPSAALIADVAAESPGPEMLALIGEANEALDAAVEHLAERARQIIRMLFFQNQSNYAELATSMRMPIGSIGPTRRRALQSLRTELENAGYELGSAVA